MYNTYCVIRKIARRGVDWMKAVAVQRVINRGQSATRFRRDDGDRPGRERCWENTSSSGHYKAPVPIWHSKVLCSSFITGTALGLGKLARLFQDMRIQHFLHIDIHNYYFIPPDSLAPPGSEGSPRKEPSMDDARWGRGWTNGCNSPSLGPPRLHSMA